MDRSAIDEDLDCQLAQRVFGLTLRVMEVDWYNYPIAVFSRGESDIYTWDENSCNATLFYRDTTLGISHLPHWSSEGEPFSSLMKHLLAAGITPTFQAEKIDGHEFRYRYVATWGSYHGGSEYELEEAVAKLALAIAPRYALYLEQSPWWEGVR